jgi:hypothetical protein
MNRRIPLLLILLAAIVPAGACQVPVFRYALERWEADDYRIVVLEEGVPEGSTKALVEQLNSASRHVEGGTGNANLVVEVADVENLTDAQQWSLLGWEDLKSFPAMQAYYPESTGIENPLWQGELSSETIGRLLDSPMRNILVERIVAGDSAIWLLVESGDPLADAEAESKLTSYLSLAESTLEIPDGVIRPEDLDRAINTSEKPLEMDDVLRSRIPLKIGFSVLKLNPADPAEAIFHKMLTHEVPGAAGQAIAVPVFGRGRMMPGIPALRLSESSIAKAASYLCGACSCQVKEQNPGIDLLVAADWASHMQDGLIVTERQLPPLFGAGDIAAQKTTPNPAAPEAGAARWGFRSLWLVAGAGILVAFAGSVFVLRKA